MEIHDLTGQIFGELAVIELDHTHWKNGAYWKCKCSCGNVTVVGRRNLMNGSVKSCGCLAKEVARNRMIDMAGKQFGFVNVIEYSHSDSNSKSFWKCQCTYDNCNNIFIASGSDLRNGKIKSCGCYRARRLRYGEASFNNLYSNYKHNAKTRGLDFLLSKDEFREITQGNCHYCGIEPRQGNKNSKAYGVYVFNGIDRVDNNIGYIYNNCVPCCNVCNVAKNNLSLDEFYGWLKRLVYYNKERF